MNIIKQNKKIALVIGVVVLLLVGIGCDYLIKNHKYFEELNLLMEDIYINPYEEKNVIIRAKTLDNMEEEIVAEVKDYNTEYDENITLSKENQVEFEEISSEEDKGIETIYEVKDLYTKDIDEKIGKVEKSIDSSLKNDIEYNSKEKKIKNNLKNEYDNIDYSEELNVSVENYNTLVKIDKKLKDNVKAAKKRIEKEKKEAEKLAKEEAEELAKEEAQKETEEVATPKKTTTTKTKSTKSTTSEPAADGNFDRGYSQSVFNAINSYRSSLGLPAYSYNSSKQSCVDSEAKAFASNGNPHNYVCNPWGAENAGYSVLGYYSPSTMVDLWKNDQPHHAPLISESLTSCAVSAYVSGGYIYVEAIFW